MKKSIGDPFDALDEWIGIELGVGVALFVFSTVGFRTTLGLGVSRGRLVAAAAALATIPDRDGVVGRGTARGVVAHRRFRARRRGQACRAPLG